jgi:HPt (histidine-containing phosphotransfer) domain-containing protein
MDITALAAELGLKEEDVRRLILTFLDSTEQDLVLLGEAFSERDAEKLHATAHHIRGAAGNLELNEIAEEARKIEEKASGGVIEDLSDSISFINSRLDMIRTDLPLKE